MNVLRSLSFVANRLVIFLITLTLLWTQFFGLSHSVHHGFASAVASSSSINNQNSADFQLAQSTLNGFTSNNSSIPFQSHNCLALDACSLASAVFISIHLSLVTSVVFFYRPLITFHSLHTKLYWNFLSRAPPTNISR
jgi:hypothetical protein